MAYSTPEKRRAYRSTPEYRAREAARQRERRKDPVVAERDRAKVRKWAAKNREKLAAQKRERRRDPATRERERLNALRYRRENRERILAVQRRGRLRTQAQDHAYREAILAAAAGRPRPEFCEVCGRAGVIHFDHCHRRNIFRGWLCKPCNVILGFAEDNANILRQLAAYLDRTSTLIPPQLTLPGI